MNDFPFCFIKLVIISFLFYVCVCPIWNGKATDMQNKSCSLISFHPFSIVELRKTFWGKTY